MYAYWGRTSQYGNRARFGSRTVVEHQIKIILLCLSTVETGGVFYIHVTLLCSGWNGVSQTTKNNQKPKTTFSIAW